VALSFAFSMYWILAEATCFAVRRATMRWNGWRRQLAVASTCAVAALAAFAEMEGLYLLTYLVCNFMGMCAFSLLPERLAYTLAHSERAPYFGVLVVLPALALLQQWIAVALSYRDAA
jgi:hypothetical protein